MMLQRDGVDVSSTSTILPAVPMFHANAWGIAQAALMAGAKLVMPGEQTSTLLCCSADIKLRYQSAVDINEGYG